MQSGFISWAHQVSLNVQLMWCVEKGLKWHMSPLEEDIMISDGFCPCAPAPVPVNTVHNLDVSCTSSPRRFCDIKVIVEWNRKLRSQWDDTLCCESWKQSSFYWKGIPFSVFGYIDNSTKVCEVSLFYTLSSTYSSLEKKKKPQKPKN